MPHRKKKRAPGGHGAGAGADACAADGAASPASCPSPAPPLEASSLLARSSVLEPEGPHEASILLLHGLGDGAAYWRPFLDCLRKAGARVSGLRWLPLNAPRREVWGERMAAWFEYLTSRDGEDIEDDINETDLLATRAALHSLVEEEARSLEDVGGRSRVLLLGSSQGGSAALDAALTLQGAPSVAGVGLLRSLALGATARALAERTGAVAGLPVLAVSGDADEVFKLDLARRQLEALGPAVSLSHHVLAGLDHDKEYDAQEVALTINFIAEHLGLGLDACHAAESLAGCLPAELPGGRPWASLSDGELQLASQLGIKSQSAWDDGSASVWSRAWDELTYLQRKAAHALGYRERSWNEMGGADEDGLPGRDKSWAAMTEAERKLAVQLGVTGANAWDSGTAPVWSKSWAKLSSSQRKAAEQLGWSAQSWDEG